MSAQKIGTVEIIRPRVYALDAEADPRSNHSTVLVEPGRYDLFADGMATWWMMRGRLCQRGIWRMGDGMFAMNASDEPSDIEVVFPSRRFGPDEWAELIATPEFADGSAQRLRVSLDTAAVTP